MADQREIVLREGDGTPKDIVLRELPVASIVTTTIYLRQGDATPKDIVLYDPTAEPAGGGGPVSGSLAATLSALTLASSGDLLIQGQAGVTFAALTLSTSGDLIVSGSLTQTLANVTLAGSGDLLVQGALGATLGTLTLSAGGELLLSGALSQTLGTLTLGASGDLLVHGSLAATLGDVSLAGAADLHLTGTTTAQLDAVTLSAAGELAIHGSLAMTLSAMTLSAAGTLSVITAVEHHDCCYGFYDGYEAARNRRENARQELLEAVESEASIPGQLDAQIARLLHEQEAKDLERADLARLQALADEYKGRQPALPERVSKALTVVQERRTLGALQALQREMDRMLEEEELAVVILLLNE